MLLFDEKRSIPILCKNKNEYVKYAVKDLAADLKRINENKIMPDIVTECEGPCIIIEENDSGNEPIKDESYSIKMQGDKIYISASGYLGTMWGIYTFSDKILGIDPCYLFNDFEPKKKSKLEISNINITDAPESFGFRGVFINDEDLLTGWKDGGGIRYMDWHSDYITVPDTVINMVIETMLRLKLNLIIPATYLNIDNPPERLIADCAARRGMYISQHHIEPVGVSAYTFKNYCDKFEKNAEFSFIKNPEFMKEVWSYYAEKWSQYDNVVWQIGLRGEGDRPVWQEEQDLSVDKLKEYGQFISNAMSTQIDIIKKAAGNKAKHFTSTLWMEGSKLMENGLLDIPEGTTIIFADNGPNQMFAPEFYKTNRVPDGKYGIYYHIQYYNVGPHLAPMTGIDKLHYNLKLCYEKGDRDYIILNCSNVREFVFELRAYSQMTWNINSFSKEKYMNENTLFFDKYQNEAKALIENYYNGLADLDISMLKYVHGEYFNYNYSDRPDGIKLCPVKDGFVLWKGTCFIHDFAKPLNESTNYELYKNMYSPLKKAVSDLDVVCKSFEKICTSCNDNLKTHIKSKWLNYAYAVKSFYEWFVMIYEAKHFYDVNNASEFVNSIEKACASLEFYLDFRKNAEYGIFKNWYRGEILFDVKNVLRATKRIICQ